jgi:hypothetical protein
VTLARSLDPSAGSRSARYAYRAAAIRNGLNAEARNDEAPDSSSGFTAASGTSMSSRLVCGEIPLSTALSVSKLATRTTFGWRSATNSVAWSSQRAPLSGRVCVKIWGRHSSGSTSREMGASCRARFRTISPPALTSDWTSGTRVFGTTSDELVATAQLHVKWSPPPRRGGAVAAQTIVVAGGHGGGVPADVGENFVHRPGPDRSSGCDDKTRARAANRCPLQAARRSATHARCRGLD